MESYAAAIADFTKAAAIDPSLDAQSRACVHVRVCMCVRVLNPR